MLAPRKFSITREFAAPISKTWEILANTNRINRAIGMGAVTYGEVQDEEDGNFYLPAAARIAGFNVSWREYPFEWLRERFYMVRRDYSGGPLLTMEAGSRLEPLGDNRTLVTLEATVMPRSAFGNAFAAQACKQFFARTFEFCEASSSVGIHRAVAREKAPALTNPGQLSRGCAQLTNLGLNQDCVRALKTLLESAPDDEVVGLRPYVWAARAGLERPEALRTCLHAVKTGLLTLQWSLICPNCRVSKTEAKSLSDVAGQVHCDLCGLSYDVNFDQYVELRFAVHPAIRAAENAVYCLSGPHVTPHILWQRHLHAGETATIPEVGEGEPLQLRVLRNNSTIAATRGNFTFDGAWTREPSDGSSSEILNTSNRPIVVVLEKVLWENGAVTAAEVTTLQEFRDLFASEALLPGRQIGVECLTLLFTDLGNSTALYERIGDAVAYGRVGAHFDFMEKIIATRRGAVVKTMGDAVMAVFHHPEDALEAAFQLQKEFPGFAAQHEELGDVCLKMGLHRGPALAVNQNDKLDYFGRTVNIAARLVSAASGPEIIVSERLLEDPSLAKIVAREGITPVPFRKALRGLAEETALLRLRSTSSGT